MEFWVDVHVDYMTFRDGDKVWTSLGKVAGFGTSNGQPVALVFLDSPFWSEDRKFFLTVLTVHVSSLRATKNLDPAAVTEHFYS